MTRKIELYSLLLLATFDMLFASYVAHENVSNQSVAYKFTHDPIDVVIPCIKKDVETLDLAIDGIKKNGKNIRNVYILSSEQYSTHAQWIDEKIFPFTKREIALELFGKNEVLVHEYLNHPCTRIGWIYQQLLKLYAAFVIPGISENVLLLDADTIFLNPVDFQDEAGAGLFNPGSEYHAPYFVHAKRLIPGFHKVFPSYSGVAHHMLFQKCVLLDLFNIIVSVHHCEPWVAIVRCIDLKEIWASSLSEYEIYFNFVFSRTNQVKIRPLKWRNISKLKKCRKCKRRGYHYASCHDFLRK